MCKLTMLFRNVPKYNPLIQQVRHQIYCPFGEPRHLICFKQWTADMVSDVLSSAMNLKASYRDTHNIQLDTLRNAKIMILQEVNEPILNMAVSKAASLLGATHVSIKDHVVWEHDYNGSIFSFMSDAMFVSTTTHMCIQRLALKSAVPVLCMRSRTHASIQSLSTIMTIMEEYGSMQLLNVAWVGPPHPILNSFLLLCPMLCANIRFKCCCKETPVSPLLLNASKEMVKETGTIVQECLDLKECLQNAVVYISGPTCPSKKNISKFTLTVKDIMDGSCKKWIFFHTCPRGNEVEDNLFYHENSRTFEAFENMQYIAASLMAYCIKGHMF